MTAIFRNYSTDARSTEAGGDLHGIRYSTGLNQSSKIMGGEYSRTRQKDDNLLVCS